MIPPKPEASARLAARRELRAALVEGQEAGSPRWLAGELLEYHRREARPQWWRWFQHLAMDAEALIEDGEAIGGLELTAAPPVQVKKSLLYELCFPAQEHKLGPGRGGHDAATGQGVSVTELDTLHGTLTIGRGIARHGEPLPRALIPGKPLQTTAQEDALARLSESMRDGTGRYPALEGILRRARPRIRGISDGAPLPDGGARGAAPPRAGPRAEPPGGAGPARHREDLARRPDGGRAGRRREARRAHGPEPQGHQQPRREVLAAADERRPACACAQVLMVAPDSPYQGDDRVDNLEDVAACLHGDHRVVAGTSWLFAREDWDRALDHLVIDEAGQMSLADTLAGGTAART